VCGGLATAVGLSAAIGLEREIRQKSAGLWTHAVILHIHGKGSVNRLAAMLFELNGVEAVMADGIDEVSDQRQ
jgi:hypothetical protein